jgi:hypothetical protein
LREGQDPFSVAGVPGVVMSCQSYALRDDGGVGKAEDVRTNYWDRLETITSVYEALQDDEEVGVEYLDCS